MDYDRLLMHPDPLLRKPCRPVDRDFIASGALATLVIAMKVHLAQEGIGLAANQVGGDRRVIVLSLDEVEFTMLNPVIVHKRGRVRTVEQCLSVRGEDGEMIPYRVVRPRHITVRFNFIEEVQGGFALREKCITAKGLLAACISHEIDHLNGISIVERSKGVAA